MSVYDYDPFPLNETDFPTVWRRKAHRYIAPTLAEALDFLARIRYFDVFWR